MIQKIENVTGAPVRARIEDEIRRREPKTVADWMAIGKLLTSCLEAHSPYALRRAQVAVYDYDIKDRPPYCRYGFPPLKCGGMEYMSLNHPTLTRCQVLYDLANEGLLDDEMHAFFNRQIGEPSPSGYDVVDTYAAGVFIGNTFLKIAMNAPSAFGLAKQEEAFAQLPDNLLEVVKTVFHGIFLGY